MGLPIFDREEGFSLAADSDGIGLVLLADEFRRAKKGSADGRTLIQLATLRILEEQGLAEEIGNGFHIPSEAAVQLDSEIREQLGLPEAWKGFFRVNAAGSTFEERFTFYLSLHRPNGDDAGRFKLDGPFIRISSREIYLPSFSQWQALSAARDHSREAAAGATPEVENLKAVYALQEAMREGAEIDLGPFEQLDVVQPERIGVAVVDTEEGGLELIPHFGGDDDPEMTHSRLGQVSDRQEEGSIRIGDRIVILDKARMRAVREVVENRKVKPDDRKAFLENPAAFIDASLIDLDLGFSIRVKGATRFRLAYFGETESSEIDWFAATEGGAKVYIGPNGARQLIQSTDDLARFEELIESAAKTGAREFRWSENSIYQFDEAEPVREELERIRRELEGEGPTGPGGGGEAISRPRSQVMNLRNPTVRLLSTLTRTTRMPRP